MPSPIDDLFESIFGFRPTKDGEAYEKLAAAVCKLLEDHSEVFHDQRLRGQFSESLYQLDVLAKRDGDAAMGEAKDYSDSGDSVVRPDLQKLGGALGDLPVSRGQFFSATDYTEPARQYAAASEDINRKPIDLFHLRPSVVTDEDERIQEIHLQILFYTANFAKATFAPSWRKEAEAIFVELLASGHPGRVSFSSTIYGRDGTVLTTIPKLAKRLAGGDPDRAWASFWLPGGHVKIADRLVPIYGITYDVPFSSTLEEVIITADGQSKLLIRAEDGSIDKLITDGDLRRVEFGPDGEVKLKS